jgi:uncharacterized DUF497 family protein
MEFDWDEANIEHIARHGVEPWEAEEVVLSDDRVLVHRRAVGGEARYSFVGTTDDDRLLFVVSTTRGRAIRVVTARRPNETELRIWRRRGR